MSNLRHTPVGATVPSARLRRGCNPPPHHGYGITKGSEIFIRKVAPLGDPVEVTIRGYELSLRKADAECVDVQTV